MIGGNMFVSRGRIAVLIASTAIISATLTGTAQARTVEMASGISFEVPDAFTISTLGGCDTQSTAMVSTNGDPLPLRSSGQVHLTDATDYDVDVAFLSADKSGLSRVDGSLTLCLPGQVELVEPFHIDVIFFGALCAGARCPGQNLPVTVIRIAPTVPDAPTDVSATASSGTARVSWTAPAKAGGAAITGYTATSDPGGLTCTTAQTSCVVTGLAKGVPYTFTVTATNAAGTSSPSSPSAPVTVTTPPGAVASLKAAAIRGGVRVSWSSPADTGGLPVTRYEYRVGVRPWVSTTATTVTITKLATGRSITVQVRAINAAGSGAPSTAKATPR